MFLTGSVGLSSPGSVTQGNFKGRDIEIEKEIKRSELQTDKNTRC